MIDTHSHIDTEDFDNDRRQVIQRAKQSGIEKIFIPNINRLSLEGILSLCSQYKGYLYPMIGLHPEDVNTDNSDIQQELDFLENSLIKALDSECPFIAVGEVGLDYYWEDKYKELQRQAFIRQVGWAKKFRLPLMIHTRCAFDDMVEIMDELYDDNLYGVFHCFSADEQTATRLLKFKNFCLGIGGILTFKKSKLPDVVKNVIPLDRIVLETDAPYMAPTPFRGKRNEPAFVMNVAVKLAEIFNTDVTKIEQITNNNVMRTFKF